MKALLAAAVAASLALNVYLAWRHWTSPAATRSTHSSGDLVVMRTPGGLLEVSTITAEERFDSTTGHTVLGVPLGRTVAQVRVPAVYRYHVPLQKDWNIRLLGDRTLLVIAPAVQPTLPVAVDTGRLESFASGLWSPITGPAAIDALHKSITARLAVKAASPQMMLLQREAARSTLGEFVQKWVAEQPRWNSGKPPAVLVFFEDEPLGKRVAPLF